MRKANSFHEGSLSLDLNHIKSCTANNMQHDWPSRLVSRISGSGRFMRAVLDEWLSILLIEDDAEIRQKGDEVTILYPEEALRLFPPTETEVVLIGDFNGGRGIGVGRSSNAGRAI